MKRNALIAAAAVAVLVFGLLRLQGCWREHETKWQADVERALAGAKAERARADSALRSATVAENDAAAASLRADSLARVAAALGHQATHFRARIDTVTVPADALPYTAPRDSLIRLLSQQVDTLGAALAEQKNANGLLLAANGTLRDAAGRLTVTVDSLMAVLERRPHARWWVPSLTLGAAAGVDARDGKVFLGPAVQLGWRLKL